MNITEIHRNSIYKNQSTTINWYIWMCHQKLCVLSPKVCPLLWTKYWDNSPNPQKTIPLRENRARTWWNLAIYTLEVSWNGGTSKSSILIIRFSIYGVRKWCFVSAPKVCPFLIYHVSPMDLELKKTTTRASQGVLGRVGRSPETGIPLGGAGRAWPTPRFCSL